MTFNQEFDPKFNPFDDNYLAEILKATVDAWALMEHPIKCEKENAITRRLAGLLWHHPYFAELPYVIVPQWPISDMGGLTLGIPDIRFLHRNSRRDYFAFEAKRLRVTYPGGSVETEYPTYAGSEGMMAFIDGQYSTELPAAGMLGYVMDGKTDKAWKGLVKSINDKRNHLKLIGGSGLANSGLSNVTANGMTGTHLGETEHDLETRYLRLFHLLLPVQYGYERS